MPECYSIKRRGIYTTIPKMAFEYIHRNYRISHGYCSKHYKEVKAEIKK